jgi:hypothetical protein
MRRGLGKRPVPAKRQSVEQLRSLLGPERISDRRLRCSRKTATFEPDEPVVRSRRRASADPVRWWVERLNAVGMASAGDEASNIITVINWGQVSSDLVFVADVLAWDALKGRPQVLPKL